ncbi:MAG: LytTR family DNA-binding domain-containing protein [Marinoscillum sp.]
MNRRYTCIAIDDDVVALKIISSLIAKTEFLELIDTYDDAIKGATAITTLKPDMVFLDIQMPNLSGMDIVRNLDVKPQIILITSQEKFALEAFEFDVTDYLLKPIKNYGRFLKAVNKAIDLADQKKIVPGEDSNNIFIKSDSLLVNLETKSILYVEAYGDYVKIHTPERIHVVYGKLKDTEAALSARDFVRVHRSFIVRIDRIKNIDHGNLLIGDKIIPVSNSHRSTLLDRIKTL